jgi:hypothetical protein
MLIVIILRWPNGWSPNGERHHHDPPQHRSAAFAVTGAAQRIGLRAHRAAMNVDSSPRSKSGLAVAS